MNPQAEAPGCGENVWRSSPALRSENILQFRLAARSGPPRVDTLLDVFSFQRCVGFETDPFNVDSRMQEADEQSEGKTVCVERRRRVGALAAGEGARALLRVILSGCLFILCD